MTSKPQVHSLIIVPGSTASLVCTNGLSPLDVMNIEKIMNFGGKYKFTDCSVGDQYVALV